MRVEELENLLAELIDGWENEVVEFKIGNRNTSSDEVGRYFSALSNEANLRGMERAWLVFGVDNKTKSAPGCEYPCDAASLNKSGGLKQQIVQGTNLGLGFTEVHLIPRGSANVILFEIPPAPQSMPIAWKGHFYARAGESLTALDVGRLDVMRSQGAALDWTAGTLENATMEMLDEEALALARRQFAEKHANVDSGEVNEWPAGVFLDRLRLMRGGKLTRAALLLLGRAEAAAELLSPYLPQIVWKLVGEETANDIFHPPFLLATTRLYSRIRNVQVRVLPENRLFATEVPKYSQKSVLEALNNCIAHQDYSRGERIVVTEYVDRLVFLNGGRFFEGRPDDYVAGDRTPRRYRNPLLSSAMRELNMIDTMGYGIHAIYVGEARRYFPLPDYETDETSVKMTMYGHVVDVAYSTLLIERGGELRLDDVLLLDRVQKGLQISKDAMRHLRMEGLIEGRAPHLRVSAKVAALTGRKTEYMKKRERASEHYHGLILEFIGKWPRSSRAEINEYLMDEIVGEFSKEEKMSKITNWLSYLRKSGRIRNVGTDANSRWILVDSNEASMCLQ